MAVEIDIDLDSGSAHGKIQALRTDLESLSDDLDLDFGVDDDLKKKIQQITDDLNKITVDVDYDDLEKAAALKAMLQGDIDTDLNVKTDKALAEIRDSLDPPDDSGVNHGDQARKFRRMGVDDDRLDSFMGRMKKLNSQPRGPDGGFKSNDYYRRFLNQRRNGGFNGISVDLDDLRGNIKERVSVASGLKSKLSEQGYGKIGDPFGQGDYDEERLGRMRQRMRRSVDFDFPDRKSMNMPDMGGVLGGDDGSSVWSPNKRGTFLQGIKKKFKAAIPSMSTFYSLLAAVIPLIVALGTQLLGVAAAMGSVAVAGGSILALGLVGHGEDMASSWEKAKEQLSTLKKEMFETFQPTMQTFAPIQARFFEMMPGELNKVATSMEDLTVFSDVLFESFSGLTDFIAEFFGVMVANEGIISQLTMRFGEIIGSSILDFFSFLVQEAYRSQGILIQLGVAFANILSGLYQFSDIIAQVVSGFTLLAVVFEAVGKLLNNKGVVAVLTFVTALAATIWASTTLIGIITMLASVWAGGLIATIISSTKLLAGYIFQTLTAAMANNALAASIANVVAFATMGIGALAGMAAAASAIDGMNTSVGLDRDNYGGGASGYGGGGGMGGPGGPGSSQTTVNEGDTYNVEVHGQMDNQSEQGLKDVFSSESTVSTGRQMPTVNSDT